MKVYVIELQMDYSPSEIGGVFSELEIADNHAKGCIAKDEYHGYNEVSIYSFDVNNPKSKEELIHFEL